MLPEIKIKKILYVTDLSEYARKVFAYAVSLANHYEASITILHVVIDSKDIYSGVLGYVDKSKWEEIKNKHVDDARSALIGKKRENIPIVDVLGQFCEDAKNEFEDQTFITDEIIVKRGNPVEEIIKQSEERNCDLIVMGSHGHGGFVDSMLGSTSLRVVRRSQKPVMLVRMTEDDYPKSF
jgi:nucleotide-binding universal stress UspA family protein